MLAKEKRLNLKKDFKWIAAGKKQESKYLKLFIKTGDPSASSGPKIGIATSSKTFKQSTKRNRARRLASAAFETIYSKLPTNVSIVALPKLPILEVKSQDVINDLSEHMEEILRFAQDDKKS